MDPRIPFAFLYLAVDLVYVATSKSVYEGVARRIQGTGFPSFTTTRILAAVLAYFALVFGWYVFATRLAQDLKHAYPAWLAGGIAGAAYGFVVYAVFNGTLHAMFNMYDMTVFVRDLVWGTLWSAILTAMYALKK